MNTGTYLALVVCRDVWEEGEEDGHGRLFEWMQWFVTGPRDEMGDSRLWDIVLRPEAMIVLASSCLD